MYTTPHGTIPLTNASRISNRRSAFLKSRVTRSMQSLLLGARGSHAIDESGNSGYLQLLAIESRISCASPNSVACAIGAWKDILFVSQLLECTGLDPDKKVVFQILERMLKSPGAGLSAMKEKRHHFGWYSSAVDRIDYVASAAGFGRNIHVSRKVVGATSTVIEAVCVTTDACISRLPFSFLMRRILRRPYMTIFQTPPLQ